MSPSMDNDQRSQQTERAKEWLEAMKARPPFGAFDEACARARLTDKQSAILREYLGPEEQERVRLYGYPWTLASSGESILARIANGLILWDRCTVTGPKRRFVQNMFGLHVEPHARAVRTDGFHITRRSQEFYSKLFEMEVISLFLVNGFAVALLDEAGPECIATRASLSVAVEAKLLDTDALLDTVFRHPPVPTREYVERLAANPIHSRTPEEQARLAEQFFRNFDRAIEQSTTVSADVAVMFIRVNWPLDDLGVEDGLARRTEEWVGSRRSNLAGAVVCDAAEARLIHNPCCSVSLDDLFPAVAPSDLANILLD